MIGDYILTQEIAGGATQEVRWPGELPIIFATGISSISGWTVEGEGCYLTLNGTNVMLTNPSKAWSIRITGTVPSGTIFNFTTLPNLRIAFIANTAITHPPVVAGMLGLQCLQLNGNALTAPPDLTGCVALKTLGIDNAPNAALATAPNLSPCNQLNLLFLIGNAFTSAMLDTLIETLSTNATASATSNGIANLVGANAPTSASASAKTALSGLGWRLKTA